MPRDDLAPSSFSTMKRFLAVLCVATIVGCGGDASISLEPGADLAGEDLSGINLQDAELSGIDLRGANLRGANLIATILTGADLSSADLREADLTAVWLVSAQLSNADLRGANLMGGIFVRADLRGADLTGADLTGTVFIEADLSGVDLSQANFEDAIFDCEDRTDVCRATGVAFYEPAPLGTTTLPPLVTSPPTSRPAVTSSGGSVPCYYLPMPCAPSQSKQIVETYCAPYSTMQGIIKYLWSDGSMSYGGFC